MKSSKIFKFETIVIDWCVKHMLELAVIVTFVLSVFMRIKNFGYVSGDATNALIPWYDAIKENGGFHVLYRQVGNYNMPYQTVLAVLTYLPIDSLVAIKLVSCIFDYLMSGALAYLVYLLTDRNRIKAYWALIVSFIMPMVILNSATWAQCDSIYTFFCILTLILFVKEKNAWAFVAYGFAVAFKLQAVFLLPFIMLYYVYKKKFSFLYFGLIPVSMIVASFAALLHGRSLIDIIYIYYKQTETHEFTSLCYASFWNCLEATYSETYYDFIAPLAICSTIVILGLIVMYILKKSPKLNNLTLLKIAFLMTYTCVLFLPSMHERYDYLYIILGLVIAFLDYRFIGIELLISYIGLRCYANYLFQTPILSFNILVFLNIIAYIVSLILIIKDISCTFHTTSEIPEETMPFSNSSPR